MTSLSPERHFLASVPEWGSWVRKKLASNAGARGYLVTLTFDQYREHTFKSDAVAGRSDFEDVRVAKADVLAGLTRRLPPDVAAIAMISDIERFYLRILRALFGGRYRNFQQWHPIGIGFLDEPAYKRYSPTRAKGRQPGDKFPHAHFVLVVFDIPTRSKFANSAVAEFEHRRHCGSFDAMWRKFNPTGEIEIDDLYDASGAIDYAAKGAKRNAVFRDHMIILPFGRAEKRRTNREAD